MVSEVVQAVRQEMEDNIREQGQVMQGQCDALSRAMQAIKGTDDKPDNGDEVLIQSDLGPVDGVDIKEDVAVEIAGAVIEQLSGSTAEQLSRQNQRNPRHSSVGGESSAKVSSETLNVSGRLTELPHNESRASVPPRVGLITQIRGNPLQKFSEGVPQNVPEQLSGQNQRVESSLNRLSSEDIEKKEIVLRETAGRVEKMCENMIDEGNREERITPATQKYERRRISFMTSGPYKARVSTEPRRPQASVPTRSHEYSRFQATGSSVPTRSHEYSRSQATGSTLSNRVGSNDWSPTTSVIHRLHHFPAVNRQIGSRGYLGGNPDDGDGGDDPGSEGGQAWERIPLDNSLSWWKKYIPNADPDTHVFYECVVESGIRRDMTETELGAFLNLLNLHATILTRIISTYFSTVHDTPHNLSTSSQQRLDTSTKTIGAVLKDDKVRKIISDFARLMSVQGIAKFQYKLWKRF